MRLFFFSRSPAWVKEGGGVRPLHRPASALEPSPVEDRRPAFRDAGERGTPPSSVHRHLLNLEKLHCFSQIARIGDRQFPRSLHRSAIADRAQNRLRCGERRGGRCRPFTGRGEPGRKKTISYMSGSPTPPTPGVVFFLGQSLCDFFSWGAGQLFSQAAQRPTNQPKTFMR